MSSAEIKVLSSFLSYNFGKSYANQSLRGYSFNRSLQKSKLEDLGQSKFDICIIGGGVMGFSTAFWIKSHSAGQNMKVAVIERDPTYATASSVLSLGGIRQQFSLQENIELSLFGADFLKNSEKYLAISKNQKSSDIIQYHPSGYLFLTSTSSGANLLHNNWTLQKKLGCKVELLSRQQLKKQFPYLYVEDIELGSFGLENEGWFDPWQLLNGFKQKAISLGVEYIQGNVYGFDSKENTRSLGPNLVLIEEPNGKRRSLEFEQCIIAAGYDSGRVSKLAGIGAGSGILSCAVPVEPRKRYVYYVHCQNGPDEGFPTLIDSTGTHARRDGSAGHFLCGRSPTEEEEPSVEGLEVDYDFFENNVWPNLVHRVSSMENLKVKSAWAGYYDYNTFDQNGIIGRHPGFKNFYFATGFSGHGIQQSPAVGRAIMELIIYGKFMTIDLQRFGFERLVEGWHVLEQNIV